MRRIGTQLIAEKKAAIFRESVEEAKDGVVTRGDFARHDLLSLLLRSNMASDLPESARLDDKDILARACARRFRSL